MDLDIILLQVSLVFASIFLMTTRHHSVTWNRKPFVVTCSPIEMPFGKILVGSGVRCYCAGTCNLDLRVLLGDASLFRRATFIEHDQICDILNA